MLKKKITWIKCYPDMTGNPWDLSKIWKGGVSKTQLGKMLGILLLQIVLNFECFSYIDNTKLLWSIMAKHLHMVSEKY